jgi:hypothetical protein
VRQVHDGGGLPHAAFHVVGRQDRHQSMIRTASPRRISPSARTSAYTPAQG